MPTVLAMVDVAIDLGDARPAAALLTIACEALLGLGLLVRGVGDEVGES